MSDPQQGFVWTHELIEDFINFRLQHEHTFRKKNHPWQDLRRLMIKNGFSSTLTIQNMREKWESLVYDYQNAILFDDTKWIYLDTFQDNLSLNVLGNESSMNWSNIWIVKLIEARCKNNSFFLHANCDNYIGWNTIECDLRAIGLPSEYNSKSVKETWLSLIKTFKKMYICYPSEEEVFSPWAFYKYIHQYFKDYDPETLKSYAKAENHDESPRKDVSDSDDDSDKSDNPEYVQNEEEFRWNSEWTESFIHVRLQNEDIFKHKYRSWARLHGVMLKNGFPQTITVSQIRKKWGYIYQEYLRATATNNTSWMYYNIFSSYLGKSDDRDTFENWSDDRIKILIRSRIETDDVFKMKHMRKESCWNILRTVLKNNSIPIDRSVRSIKAVWFSLLTSFKEKYKFPCNESEDSSNMWKFHDDMLEYFRICNPSFLKDTDRSILERPKNKAEVKCDSSFNRDFTSTIANPIENLKTEYFDLDSCRACLGRSENMSSLFENDLVQMITFCTTIQMSQVDNLPQTLCQTCVEQLEIAFKFKKKCEESDRYLRSIPIPYHNNIKVEKLVTQSSDALENDYMDFVDDKSEISIKEEKSIETEMESLQNEKKIKVQTRKKRKKDIANQQKKPIQRKRKNGQGSKNVVFKTYVSKDGQVVGRKTYVYKKVCEICGKASQRIADHMRSHSDARTLTCPKCPSTFKYMASLQTHLRTHESTPLKICPICGRKFFRNLTYKRHLVYHENERKFSCDTCGKTFNTKDILQVHIRSHTGERPYSCRICGKSFYSRGCVSRHQKVHRKQNVIALEN